MRMDDRIPTHPKMVRAGISGWLWFCGNCYCRAHLTDGFIPQEALPQLAPGITRPKAHAQRLIEVGLWHEAPGGYRVHDFLEWNPSRAQIGIRLESDRNRKDSLMRGRAGDAISFSGSSSEEESRELKLWNVWREAMTAKGVNVHLQASANEYQSLRACCELVGSDDALHAATRLLVGMEQQERRDRYGVKSLTLGYLKMALPDLLERVTAIRSSCRHGHQPPCADDAICTKRYLDDCQRGVA